MELGNMIFGCSRGEVAVERGQGREEQLDRLFEAVAARLGVYADYHGHYFENDVFSLAPYYWGDCACGYAEREERWWNENAHAADCYQTELNAETAAMEKRIGYAQARALPGYDPLKEPERHADYCRLYDLCRVEEKKIYRSLCERHGIPWDNARGSAVHCTCDYDKRWNLWCAANDHKADCLLVVPNFLHKPSGYQLKWYKYPLRDAYASREASLEEFTAMVEACVASVRK